MYQVLNEEASYRVVIDPGSGNEIIIDIMTADNCTDSYCHYIFTSDNITESYSVAVEVVGCGTGRISSRNISTCEYSVPDM